MCPCRFTTASSSSEWRFGMFLGDLVYFGLAGKQTPVEVVTDEIGILFFPIDCPEYQSHLERKKESFFGE